MLTTVQPAPAAEEEVKPQPAAVAASGSGMSVSGATSGSRFFMRRTRRYTGSHSYANDALSAGGGAGGCDTWAVITTINPPTKTIQVRWFGVYRRSGPRGRSVLMIRSLLPYLGLAMDRSPCQRPLKALAGVYRLLVSDSPCTQPSLLPHSILPLPSPPSSRANVAYIVAVCSEC